MVHTRCCARQLVAEEAPPPIAHHPRTCQPLTAAAGRLRAHKRIEQGYRGMPTLPGMLGAVPPAPGHSSAACGMSAGSRQLPPTIELQPCSRLLLLQAVHRPLVLSLTGAERVWASYSPRKCCW